MRLGSGQPVRLAALGVQEQRGRPARSEPQAQELALPEQRGRLASRVFQAALSFPGDAFTVSLLHFEGANASTTFTDEVGKIWTRWFCKISTAQAQFGNSSGLFGGGDQISTPESPDLMFGNGDWTVDFWVRTVAAGQSVGTQLVSKRVDASTGGPFAIGLKFWNIRR